MAKAYDQALECLIGKKDEWIELRRQSSNDPANFWKPFQESYDLVDFATFDDAYFDTYGQTMVARIVNYVRSHKDEFIAS